MPVQVIAQICCGTKDYTGKGVCEDTYAIVGDAACGAAWVLDGATNLDRNYVPGVDSDAAWYAQSLSAALQKTSLNQQAPGAIFRHVIEDVATEFNAKVDRAALPLYAQPSAAGVWLRWQDNQFDYASLGDCRVIVKTTGDAARLIGPDADIFSDARRNQQIKELREANNLQTADDIFEFFLPHNRTARATMNTENGYRIFSIHADAADHLDQASLTLNKPAHILLMSDGLFRLIDVIPTYNLETLMATAINNGLQSLYDELRALEQADPDCHAHPRTKAFDDVSAILLQFS